MGMVDALGKTLDRLATLGQAGATPVVRGRMTASPQATPFQASPHDAKGAAP